MGNDFHFRNLRLIVYLDNSLTELGGTPCLDMLYVNDFCERSED